MGLDSVCGTGTRVDIGGTTYSLARLGIGAFGEVVAEIKRRRWVEVRAAMDAFRDAPADVIKEYLDPMVAKAKQPVDFEGEASDEFDGFMQSPGGACFVFWVLVRVRHPEVNSTDKARALLDELAPSEIKQLALDIIKTSGLEELQEAVKN